MTGDSNDRPYRPFKNQAVRTARLRRDIRRFHKDGWSRAAIARHFNLTAPTIGYHAKAMGLTWRRA